MDIRFQWNSALNSLYYTDIKLLLCTICHCVFNQIYEVKKVQNIGLFWTIDKKIDIGSSRENERDIGGWKDARWIGRYIPVV